MPAFDQYPMILSGDSFWAPFVQLLRGWCDQGGLLRRSQNGSFLWCPSAEREKNCFTGWTSAGWRRYAIRRCPAEASRSQCFVNGSEREVQGGGVGLGPSRADRRVPRNQKTSTLKSKTWEYTGHLTLPAALQRPNERWVFSCYFMLLHACSM